MLSKYDTTEDSCNLFNAEVNAAMHLAAVIESSIEAKFPNSDSWLVESNSLNKTRNYRILQDVGSVNEVQSY